MIDAAVLFDMDGTLLRLDVDIEEVRTRLGALFAPLGVSKPFRPILRRIREAAAEAAPGSPDHQAELTRAGLAILSDFELAASRSARPRERAAEVIGALAARGVGLGLITDNGRACIAPALAAAGIDPASFAAVITRDDVATPKPDPAGILRAAGALDARTVWYVGDHPRDVEAAHAARGQIPSLRVAALRGGHAPDAQLAQAGADAILGGLAEVLTLPLGSS